METWRKVLWYENFYEVSNLWKVRWFDRVDLVYSERRWVYHRFRKWKELCPTMGDGYPRVALCNWKDIKYFRVSRLVLSAFKWLDISDLKSLACHFDDNPSNSRLDNLFIGTHSDNMKDMISKGRSYRKWEKWRNSKLTDSNVKMIKQLLIGWAKNFLLAKYFSVSSETICCIKKWINWSHISAF